MERVILLLGGNVGDVEGRFARACEMLSSEAGAICGSSSIKESEPWGFDEQGRESIANFRNQAIMLDTRLEAEELLDVVQSIECRLGRVRHEEQEMKARCGVKYLSRVVDIDIIFYGDRLITTPRLVTPHALMAEREFVLEPLVEIAPDWRHPQLGLSCAELLKRLRDR